MRILFVAPILPHPPLIGSAVITLNQIRVLSARHQIDLISFKHRANSTDLGDLPRWCDEIELVHRPSRWRVLLSILRRALVDPLPEISRFSSAEMSRVVAKRLAGERYDVVLFQTVQAAQFRPDWYSGATIWSLEDPPALKTERMLAMYPWYSRSLHRKRIDRLRRYDLTQAKRFGCITFVNREDAIEYMQAVPGARADFVPHGITEESVSRVEVSRRKGMIVITGNMYHVPNVDAVEFFCRDIFPLVCDREPSANLWLVGARPVARVRRWASNPRIKITGFVPDVRTYIRQAVVSVCPVRLRVGTQTKILEALTCGTPVVTSSAGNYGIGAVSGRHLYVTDDPREFAKNVVSLLVAERWNELSENGRRFVGDRFSWESSAAKLEQIMERLVEDRGAKSTAR
jgi:glycosyltransferase involved in cell wall biosynthesis